MYTALIKDKFPHDESNGLYKVPQLPAVRLGRILARDTRIASPNDVVAIHLYSSTFSKGTIILTHDACYYDKGQFLLEDLKEVQENGSKLTIFVNQQGQFIPHELSVKNKQVAHTLRRVFEGLMRNDPTTDQIVKQSYEGFSHTELDWLNLRDEIMRTIDMLYERYNDGKLTLLEYESKKDELLGRL